MVGAIAICSMVSGTAIGQIHEGDIALGVDGTRLAVGDGSRDMSGNLLWDECAFGVLLDTNARTTDPGFDTDSGAFPPSASIGYAYRAALRKWDGSDFDDIPAERIRMSFGPLPGISTPLADPAEPIEGVFAGVGSNGEYHTHYAIRLERDGSPATGTESLGVYLLELELRIDSGIYAPTEPFWFVLSNGASTQDLADALAFARDVIGGCGETPGCLADVNGDGIADPSDFTAWVAAYNQQLPAADQNGDGLISPADFSAWVANYNLGCP